MVFTILSELTYPTQTRTLLNPEIFQNFLGLGDVHQPQILSLGLESILSQLKK